jgi:hypothetical protein
VERAVEWVPLGDFGYEFLPECHLDGLGHVFQHPVESHVWQNVFPGLGFVTASSDVRVTTGEERLFAKLFLAIVTIKQDDVEELPVLVIRDHVQRRLDDIG